MNILALAKLAKSGAGIGPDELAELLDSLGFQIRMQEVAPDERKDAFQATALTSLTPGSRVARLTGKFKTGEAMDVLLVWTPADAPQKLLDT